jgi:hypothetical protein
MKAKFFNDILIKALMIICSPILILLFGLIGFCIAFFGESDYDEF